MAAQLKSILCSKCGAPLAVHHPRARTIVCAHCRAQLDLTKEPYEFLGYFRTHNLRHPLRLGLQAQLDGLRYTVVGHVRYVESTWWWDEYLGLSEDGRALWIQYDEGAFSIFTPFVPQAPEPIEPKATFVTIDGVRHEITEQGTARVSYLDGEFTFRVKRGDLVQYVDAGALAVELTEREVEFFSVRTIDRAHLAEAVGLTLEALEVGCYDLEDGPALDAVDRSNAGPRVGRDGLHVSSASSQSVGLVGMVVFVFFGGCMVALENCDDPEDDDRGGTHVVGTGAGSRSTGRGSFGGGFSGGK